MKKLVVLVFWVFSTSVFSQITIDDTLTTQELVEDILINSSCAEVSNFSSSTGTDFGDVNGIAAFDANGSDFPFEAGIVLISGDVTDVPGPNTNIQGAGGWPGDADLEANTTAVNTNNASSIQFDFTPFIEQISFNFIMASEEYDQNFECTFSDAFAFILTDQTTGTVQNLAVLPGTTIPIEVTNIRPEVPGQCAAVNEEFFDRYNFLPFNDENTSATNFNGQTVPLSAMADVVVGNLYTIKLVVADQGDSNFDIGVFLEAGSFNIGATNLGDDILVSTGNAGCEGDVITLDAEDPDALTYTWFMDGVEIVGETSSTLDVTVAGTYSVSVTLNGTDCTIEDEIIVEFITEDSVDLGDDIEACEGDTVLLDTGIPSDSATFAWLFNNIPIPDEFGPTLVAPITGNYEVQVTFNAGCAFSDTAMVTFLTTPDIELGDAIESCLENTTTLDASPSNADPATATYEWSLGGVVIAGETGPTLDIDAAGTYQVVVTIGMCTATDSVTVSPVAIDSDLGDDFNTCFQDVAMLDATPTNIDPTLATYEWTLNGAVIAGETLPTLTIVDPGSYGVTITFGICTFTDTILVQQANPDGSICEDGGAGCVLLEAGEDIIIDCDTECVTLDAALISLPLTATSSYIVNQIECPLPPVSGGDATNLTTDDVWSDVIDLPFTFNYYQNDYTSLVVGANGQISFDTSLANGFNDWNSDVGQLIPVDDPGTFPLNTIYGAFHDINPGTNGDPDAINFFVSGDAPYRTFVLNFDAVPQFSCTDLLTTQQIILYESLNIIEVNIIDKPVCETWNDGLATLGIMGNDLTEFAVAPGRNTDNWAASNESWRFIPNGDVDSDSVFEWLDTDGNVLSNDPMFEVCPTEEETTYIASLTFELPDGTTNTITDDILVTRQNPDGGPCTIEICEILDAGEDVALDCETPCTTLEASVITIPFTTTSSYVVNDIDCPLPPIDGGDPTNLTTDDVWSDVIDLPFTFNYYQNDYTSLVVGANGQISFDTSLANGFNDWNSDVGQLIPVDDPGTFPLNTIYGAFHDINPGTNGDPDAINFFISGTAPYRVFVLSFNEVPQFSCTDLLTTQQILLYESLNIIEVNIIDKPVCETWNDGLATLGIMGNDLTEFAVAPGRNTDNWAAMNESWRFIPNGDAGGGEDVFAWLDADGNVLSNDLSFEVCPTEPVTVYTASLTITLPDGTVSTVTDDVTVTIDIPFTLDIGEDQQFCDVDSFEITATLEGEDIDGATYLWSTGETTQSITVTDSDTYTVEVTIDTCVQMQSITLDFGTTPDFDLGSDIETCFDNVVTLDGTPSNVDATMATYVWFLDGTEITGAIDPTLTITENGTYELQVTLGNCTGTDTITVNPRSDLEVSLGDDFETCFEQIETLTATTDEVGVTYQWFFNGEEIIGEVNQTLDVFENGTYEVVITLGECTGTDAIIISPRADLLVSIIEGDFRTCPNEEQTLTASTEEAGVTYQWFLNGDAIAGETNATLVFTLTETTVGTQEYSVTITQGQCTGSSVVGITLYDVGNCTISQGISPDGSPGFNDSLDLEFLSDRTGIEKLQIFNRSGRLVFERENYVNEWQGQTDDGNELPTGTYFYVIDFTAEDPAFGRQATGWIYINRAE